MKKKWIYFTGVAGVAVLLCTGTKKPHVEKKMQRTVQIGVAVYDEKDAYISHICEYLDKEVYELENQHPEIRIQMEYADAGGSQREQNKQISRFVSLGYDLLLVNIVDRTNAAVLIDQADEAGIPVVFFNREPVREDIMRRPEVYYEGSDARQSALLQAEIIADAFAQKDSSLDKNKDGILEFAMLEGEFNHQDTLIRSEWVIKGIEQQGIQTKKVVSSSANWERGQADVLVSQWLKEYPDQMELIICNNDDMAIGASKALQNARVTDIQVVGIDGVHEAEELVEEGRMLGTVLCDTRLHAKALVDFIEALAVNETGCKEMNLKDERYYMIPLRKIVKSSMTKDGGK